MGRIHRYGQRLDCLIFNFVATNTIEGRVLQRLLSKLQEIRDALDDDAVFNVVGEVLPASQVDRVFRDYYSGKLGDADLEDRLLRDVDEGRFREICQTALEGWLPRSSTWRCWSSAAPAPKRTGGARNHRPLPRQRAPATPYSPSIRLAACDIHSSRAARRTF